MVEAEDPRNAFEQAAVEWSAGGRGQVLVDAAARALVAGLDSPTLRLLAGATRASADEEATEFATRTFEELGLDIPERFSTDAIFQFARQRAARFLQEGGSPRAFADELWNLSAQANDPELIVWSGLGDWYRMIEDGTLHGKVEEVDQAVLDAAHDLAQGKRRPTGRSGAFSQPPSEPRRWRLFQRRKPRP